MSHHSRRRYLQWVAAGSAVGLAGCSGDDGDDTEDAEGGDDSEPDPEPTTEPTDSDDDLELARDGREISWPMAHQNPANNTALETWGPVEEPSVEWSFPTDYRVRAAPIVTDEAVYAVAGDGYEGVAYALDRDSGDQLWAYETGGVEYSTPALHDGVLYFGGRRFEGDSLVPVEFDGCLYAVDADTGEELWLMNEEAGDILDGAPVVVDGTVYVTGDDGTLYSVDAESGVLDWELSLGGTVRSSPAVVDGVLYVGTADNRGDAVYAVDVEDEAVSWEKEVDEFVVNAPVVHDGVVYVADHHRTYAFDAADGERLWTYSYDGVTVQQRTESTAAVRDDTAYVTSGGSIAAVDAGDGSERWGEAVSGAGSTIPGGPVVTQDVVYAADGDLYALRAADGEPLWTYEAESVSTEPVVVDGRIYVGGREGVYALSE